jgi:hypothetical protein
VKSEKLKINLIRVSFLLAITCFAFACNRTNSASVPSSIQNDGEIGTLFPREMSQTELVKQRTEKIKETIKLDPPIMLAEGLDEFQTKAQTAAIKDAKFLENVRDETSKEGLFNQIFAVNALRDGDFTQATASCKQSKCYRVEMYNFAKNLTTNAVVDANSNQVLSVNKLPNMQPDVPKSLVDLAVDIAANSPEVTQTLGYKPEPKDLLMSGTKTALNKTRCERSLHLCVAPTAVKDGKALWTIVDLTDLAVVGVRWTKVGSVEKTVTERRIQDEYLTAKFCESKTPLDKNGWKFDYMLTNSDGLKIEAVSFNGKPVLNSAKLVDWHVSYSKNEGFGYSDAVGCPYFSHAAVIASEAPKVAELVKNGQTVGFSLQQKYISEGYPQPCNYSYLQSYEFYNDGSFRPAVASLGRGCGNDGTYRPVTRISFAGEQNTIAEWNRNDWKNWTSEAWTMQKPDTSYTKEGFQFKLSDAIGQGFYVEPNRGQFGDNSRGDFAYIYATKNAKDRDEGESELTTIGPCCNVDYKQGPEKFIEPAPENIENSSLVLWYVPQLKNDDTKGKEYCWAENYVENGVYKTKVSPCNSGAMFRPIK